MQEYNHETWLLTSTCPFFIYLRRDDERGGEVLKHYDGVVHRGLFTLSKALRGSMRSDERIMTMDDPIFMY